MKFLRKWNKQDQDKENNAAESPEDISAVDVDDIIEMAESLPESAAVNEEANQEDDAETDDTAEALPEAPLAQQPHALIEGSFLHDRWEISELVRRGAVNFYTAIDEQNPGVPVIIAQQHHLTSGFAEPLQTALWQPLDVFVQDECDYAVFGGTGFTALGDWREAPNDERYLHLLESLLRGLQEWKKRGVAPAADGLWGVDDARELRYYGFLEQEVDGQENDYEALLREISQTLLKRVFTPSATMRLDDAWSALPFCAETLDLVRAIHEDEISLEEADVRLTVMNPAKVLLASVSLQTDVGQERELNEDSGGALRMQRVGQDRQQEIDLWAICDGMGGHESGEVASELALATLQLQVLRGASEMDFGHNAAVRNALSEIAQRVNREVFELGAGQRTPPGTTLVGALRVGRRLFVINVGDSRAYLWRGGKLRRVTRDHSYVQELIDHGEIAPEEAFGHPQGNIITSNIGLKKLEKCDIFMHFLQPDDTLLLVSDGVTDMLDEASIAAILAKENDVCRALVEAANEAGGLDNITVLAARLQAAEENTIEEAKSTFEE